jgi:hypothetical protein
MAQIEQVDACNDFCSFDMSATSPSGHKAHEENRLIVLCLVMALLIKG